jgi:hypothetical protein
LQNCIFYLSYVSLSRSARFENTRNFHEIVVW